MASNKALEIDLLPVERGDHSGDCIALRYGNLEKGGTEQTVIVVDGGYAANGAKLKKHLKDYYNCVQNGKVHINIVFLSHPDQDHVEGLVKLIEDNEVKVDNLIAMIPWKVMTPKWFRDGRITENSLEKKLEDAFKQLNDLVKKAKEKKIKIILTTKLSNPCVFNGATFTTLGPNLNFYKTCIANCEKTPDKAEIVRTMSSGTITTDSDKEESYVPGHIKWDDSETTSPINESSHIMLFKYEGHKILFCGDAGKEALKNALTYAAENNIDLTDIDIIKIPHHGSRKNVSPKIMDYLKHKGCRCYIPCKAGDEGHHPSKRLVNMLLEKGFSVLTTSGATLHKGWDAPDRGWKTVTSLTPYPQIEKL